MKEYTMKRNLIGLLASLVAATALVAAQSTTPSQTKPAAPTPAEVTLTGCLIQGSGPTTWVLDNARANAQDRTEKGQSYRLEAVGEDLAFAQNVNHEVSVTGSVEKAPAPTSPGSKVTEKDLPKLSAKTLMAVADKCTATR
jgi:hypothetical protein